MILRVLLSLTAAVAWAADAPVRLFNGKNLDGFDTFLQTKGLNNDPEKVFQVHDGMVHISGSEYGYIVTKQEYENYYLRAEFKWGEKTWPPRVNAPLDSGICYHAVGPLAADPVYPRGRAASSSTSPGTTSASSGVLTTPLWTPRLCPSATRRRNRPRSRPGANATVRAGQR